jgi:hypothetical protein
VALLVRSRYGGVLSDLTRPERDGATRCPSCGAEGFEPVWLDREYVRSVGCRTVFRRTPAAGISATFDTAREARVGIDGGPADPSDGAGPRRTGPRGVGS